MKEKIALYFIIQYTLLVDSVIMGVWFIRSYNAISFHFFRGNLNTLSGTGFLIFCISGIIATEYKMRKIKNERRKETIGKRFKEEKL